MTAEDKSFTAVSYRILNHSAVVALAFDLEKPEEDSKRDFVSGCMTGIRHHSRQYPHVERESDQSTRRAQTNRAVRKYFSRNKVNCLAK